MRAGAALLATLVLVSATITLQTAAEDLYWEGEEDASNEFLEVKEESLGIGSHFKRLKRGLWDFWSSPEPSTEKPAENIEENVEKEINQNNVDEETENELGSGLPDRGDAEIEPREKTLRVTIVVYQPYQTEYNKRDSIQFKTFSKDLADAVNQLYDQLPGTQRASLVRIQSRTTDEFTCKVTLDIVTTGYDNTDRISSILEEHIRDKRTLGNIAVSDTDFTSNVIDPVSAIAVCAADEITCGDGACVAGSARCNGQFDCADGSDEEGCPPTADRWAQQETETATEFEPGADGMPGWPDNYNGVDETGVDETGRGDLGGNTGDESTPTYSDTTTQPPNVFNPTCRNDELRCDETRCVALSVRCDGRRDCYDGADEQNCEEICGPDDFRCSNGKCIENARRCDTVTDCQDGEDEINCACSANEFTCVSDGSCIEFRKRCDGVPNCMDQSDELDCVSRVLDWTGHHVCKDRGKFRCRDGTCISVLLRCDGFKDCARDGSDEIGCPCSSDQWQCDHGSCIKRVKRCDGRVDCPTDRSDERYCIAGGYFRCSNGNLIPQSLKCNHRYDCGPGDYSDERNCPCGVGDFKCATVDHCIPESKHCDRYNDCQDGSDERNCTYGTECMAYEYKCSSGQCVRADSKCNGTVECADGSDEMNCPCKRGSFPCHDGTCINMVLRCNGVSDCLNGEDERDCPSWTRGCPRDDWKCGDGVCIRKRLRCDGHPDCRDGSDEVNCYPYSPKPLHRASASCPADMVTCARGSAVQCGRRCDGRVDCSDGEDENNCEECNHECDGRCLRDDQICNGVSDCSDGSDELHCDNCDGPKDFRCRNGECIGIHLQCNGVPECSDLSDELNCGDTVTPASSGCSENMFQCRNGECINSEFFCDGHNDCTDKSDEENCPCRGDEFQCSSGQCILASEYCDGTPQCSDGSDEQSCPTTRPWITTTPAYPYQPTYRPNYDPYDPANNRPSYRPNPPRPPITTAFPPYPSNNNNQPNQGSSEVCSRNEWRCENGPCIESSRRCDGHVDCPFDQSDELDCPADSPVELRLRTYPDAQSVRNGGDVVFQCRDEGRQRAPVRWVREGGRPFKPGSTDRNGRLEMIRVSPADSGTYICQATGYLGYPGSELRVQLTVDTTVTPDPSRGVVACQAYQATCGNGECIPKSAICDGNRDCSDGSDEESCNLNGMCEPNEFQCDNRKCVLKTWLCDKENDCGDNSDEANCGPAVVRPGECLPVEFKCRSGDQCVPKSFHCDGQSDCIDGSDEIGCLPVHITKPPNPANVKLNPGDTLVLRCEAVGVPTPLISWRLNWGHVPQNCTSTSHSGVGVLTCHNMQPEHSGAYSCEAINNRGTVFANPDSIVYVNRTDVCPNGYFNSEARSENECIRCFCFGESTQCRSADLFTYNMPTPLGEGGTRLVGIKQSYNGQVQVDTQPITDRFYYESQWNGATVTKVDTFGMNRYNGGSHPYLTLPETYNGNQLTSYGGYIRYQLSPHLAPTPYSQDDGLPDIIIKGKYESLVHHHRGDKSKTTFVEARLTPEHWMKSGQNGISPATREDIMMALDNIEMILLRADLNNAGVNITEFAMESAQHVNVGMGVANLVEECTCPPGYEGLSCQKCASGYVRERSGPWLGNCVPDQRPCPLGEYGDPTSGYACRPCPCPLTNPENNFARSCSVGPSGRVICDCQPGYGGENCEYCEPGYVGNPLAPGDSCRQQPSNICNEVGTQMPTLMGGCQCKENVVGQYCDQCMNTSFYLSQDFRHGCALCFCSGVSQECRSTNYRRKTTTVRFNTPQIVQQVHVYNSSSQSDVGSFKYSAPKESPFTPRLIRGQIGLNEVSRSGDAIYYWSLPPSFALDKVTAYGGYLTYSLSNVPPSSAPNSKNNAADVQLISDNRLTFLHFGHFVPSSDGTLNASVQFLEKYWQRADGKEVSREHFLLALADVKAILVKATYSSYANLASIESASIDTAEPNGNGPQALHVEECICPTGYKGLSCEDCADGYTRSSSGIYLAQCEPCECNGHASNCHPETGVCLDCRDNTAGDNCEYCLSNYEMNQYNQCIPSYGPPLPDRDCSKCNPSGEAAPCEDGICQCKQNVEGESCDSCRPGTFGLDRENPLGCLPCYCSGVTTQCHEAGHYSRIEVPAPIIGPNYGGYSITNLNGDTVYNDQFVPDPNESELLYTFNYPPNEELFWSLPGLPGNRVLSYGGYLRLTQKFLANDPYEISKPGTDVVLVGDTISVYWTNPSSIRSDEALTYQVPLHESGWYVLNTATPASRNDFMAVIRDLKRVLVRASLAEDIQTTAIADVSMDTAVPSNDPNAPAAKGVEVCMCPEGYSGTSCETCASQYYRDPYNTCRLCPCNGHDCQINSRAEVVCNCRPPYSGRDCSTVGVVMELLPTIHENGNPYDPFRQITLTCKYRAPEPLTIRFYFEGREVGLPKYYYESTQHHDGFHGEHVWNTVWDTRRRRGETYSCHTLTVKGFTLGALTTSLPQTDGSSSIRNDTRPPPPESTVVVRITSPYIKIEAVGSSVNFTCMAYSRITPASLPVTWSKRGGNLPQGRYQVDGRTGLLLITNLQTSDSGVYVCQTSDGVNTGQAEATLRVPGNEMTVPEVRIQPQSSSYYVGDRIEIDCVSTGNPMPRITWQRTGNYPLPRTVNPQDTRLVIESAEETDSGEYRCIATNTAGSTDRVAIIRVRPQANQVPRDMLSVKPTRPEIREGDTLTIVCTGTPNIPAGAIDWVRKDGTQFQANVRSDGGVLYINYARPDNQGVYTCVSSSPDISPVSVVLSVLPLGPPPPAEQPNVTVAQNQISVYTGDSASVDCTPLGFPQPLIRWRKHDGDLGPRVSQRANSLIINNAQESDEAYYVCEGLVDGIPIETIYVYVDVIKRDPPVVEIWPPGEQAVALGSEFELHCRVLGGVPEPDISWSRSGGRPLSPHTQIRTRNMLKFERIEVNDEGEYQCVATNDAGTSSASAVLKVRSPPEITITPSNFITAFQGDSLNVECRARGYPEPFVSISLNSETIVTQAPGMAVLRLPSVRDRDEGDYVCTATSAAGTIDEEFVIRVDRGDGGDGGNVIDYGGSGDPPYPEQPASLIAIEGEESTIACEASPGYRVVWRRADNSPLGYAVQRGYSLIIYNASKSDSGRYECSIYDENANEVQQSVFTDLKVVSPPRITLQPKTQTVLPGNSPTVECIVHGDDIIDVTWRGYLGRPLPRRVQSRGQSLIFQEIEVEDAGQYECVARNLYANASAVAEVIVSADTGRVPSESHENEQWAHVGAAVHLSCNVTQPDLRIRWTKDGRSVPASRQNRDGSLYIRHAIKSDSGLYVCLIEDRYGRKTSNYINLHIEGSRVDAPSFVSIDQPRRAFRVGESVQVLCRGTSRNIDVSWERFNADMQRQYVENRKYGDGSLLVVPGVQEADAGVYRCTGTDPYGRTSYEDFNLEVTPVTIGPSMPIGDIHQYTARLGQSVDMPCIHDLEEPVAVEWRREYTPLAAEVRRDEPNIHLERVTEADAGTYVCRVSNSRVAVEARAILRVAGVVPRFDGASWLALPSIKDAYRQLEIEVSFNPTDANGLILYNAGNSGDHVGLMLVNGVPEFVFLAASESVVVRGDRPLQLNTWHTIRINRINAKVSMDVDNTGPFVADSREWDILELDQPLYIGGVPDYVELPAPLDRSTGFMGCISMLILGREEKNIMVDSKERHDIKECDTCTPNLCYNNGVCQEARNERGYMCLCATGFAGLNCDRTGEACRPGLCGPGKCSDTPDGGYKCACPVSYTGRNCDVRQQIEYPAFTGSAYLAIKAPETNRYFQMSMKIKASSPVTDGIIMYCAETTRGYGGFTSLGVREGKLEFRYDLGDGSAPVILTTNNTLPANDWITVHILRAGNIVSLKVNTKDVYEQKLDLPQKTMHLDTPMFVGGVDDSIILNKNVGVSGGFNGCIKEVTIYQKNVDIVNSSIQSANVQECSNYDRGDIPENENTCSQCRNGGQCLGDSTSCSCPPGYSGVYCETRATRPERRPYGYEADPCAAGPCRNNGICRVDRKAKAGYACDCPLGFAGISCQIVMTLYEEVGFNGNGYLELPSEKLRYDRLDLEPVEIALAFHTNQDGVLLYQREAISAPNYGDFILLRIEQGHVVLDWDLGSGPATLIIEDIAVTDGERHGVIVMMNSSYAVSLEVDHAYSRVGKADGLANLMNADSNIYIGGIPDKYNVQQYPGLSGCIEQVELMDTRRSLKLGEVAVAGWNAQRCRDHRR